jgi:hypothetical protein
VPYENIVCGSMASVDLGLTCAINVEVHDNTSFSASNLYKESRLKEYLKPTLERKSLMIESGVWIPFAKNEEISYEKIIINKTKSQRCISLFNTIAINPYSEMFACCGLTAEHIPFFRLGNVKKRAIKEMYNHQFQDFLKIWLFVEVPAAILKYADKKLKREERSYSGHTCFLCAEIFKNAENIETIQKHYQDIMPSVMLKYSLLKINY